MAEISNILEMKFEIQLTQKKKKKKKKIHPASRHI